MKQKLLILFFAVAIAGLLFNSSCKTAEDEIVYDIRGVWNFTSTIYSSWSGTFTFTGSSSAGGSCTENDTPMTGTWTMTGTAVHIVVSYVAGIYTYDVTINNDNFMSGTLYASWEPTKIGTANFTR